MKRPRGSKHVVRWVGSGEMSVRRGSETSEGRCSNGGGSCKCERMRRSEEEGGRRGRGGTQGEGINGPLMSTLEEREPTVGNEAGALAGKRHRSSRAVTWGDDERSRECAGGAEAVLCSTSTGRGRSTTCKNHVASRPTRNRELPHCPLVAFRDHYHLSSPPPHQLRATVLTLPAAPTPSSLRPWPRSTRRATART